MNDPLFGTLEMADAAALFGGEAETFAPSSAERPPWDDMLGLDPALPCGVLPWHAGAFGLLLHDLPPGVLSLGRDGESLPILAQARLLRPDGPLTLLVVAGQLPVGGDGDLLLAVSADDADLRFPLRPTAATFDRPLVTLIGQALSRSEGAAREQPNWLPLTRHLAAISEVAVRADLSMPIGPGLALVLDGDIGLADEDLVALALDGPRFAALKARVAADPQTGRSIVVLPVLAARCFLLHNDGLVDISCPPGATRSGIARTAGAMPLRPNEGELLLDLLAALELEVGPRVPDWLPVPHALGWRGADGGSLAVVGAVPVEAGTVLFLASDNRDHELASLTVHDIEHGEAALFDVCEPLAAFHPDADRHPGRLHLVLLLPRRLPAGAVHVALAGAADGGGWLRTMDAAAHQTAAILRAWLPPPPSEEAYLRIVAASVRTAAARSPAVVAVDQVPDAVRDADAVALVISVGADADALAQTACSLPVALRRSIPVVFVLSSADPGFDETMVRLASTAVMDNLEIGVLVVAGPAGASTALTAAFARLRAATALVIEAGARFTGSPAALEARAKGKSRGRRPVVLAEGASEPAAALLPRHTVERWFPAADRRLATVPAVLGDIARYAAARGETVTGLDGFTFESDPAHAAAFEALVDRSLLAAPRPSAVNRGTA